MRFRCEVAGTHTRVINASVSANHPVRKAKNKPIVEASPSVVVVSVAVRPSESVSGHFHLPSKHPR